MRTTSSNSNRRLVWLTALAFGALLVAALGGFFRADAAPLEEDIPQSAPAPHRMRVRPNPVATVPAAEPRASAASDSENAAAAATDRTDETSASTPVAPATTTLAAHKFFPYTIRSGDTLETIADIFGVQVSDITRVNRRLSNDNLIAGETIRIPNPFVTRESELNAEIERLSIDKQAAERKADEATNSLAAERSQLETAAANNAHYEHDLHTLPWWRAAAWTAWIAVVVMFGMMLGALIEWWNLRWRYRAVAEMNDSLRRLDYRYRMVMAKAELRLQELYGRRRRGIEDGQERPKIPEENERDKLDRQIRVILEGYLQRLGPPNNRARRARWREAIGALGAPIEARTARR